MAMATCERGVANCQQFWRDSRNICLACGKEPPLAHEHRFPGLKAGDTMPVCADCRMTVQLTPAQAAELAGEKPPAPPAEPTMPELIFGVTGGVVPPYMKLVQKYHRMMGGTYGW